MMRWLIAAALRQRALVLALAAVLVVLGIHAAQVMPLDVFPEFAPPLVEIQTEAPGLSTEEVESLITVPVENAVNGTAWLKTLRSKSVLGLSSVVCILQEGTDLMRARQLIQERVALVAPRLPAVARPPVLLPPLSSTSRALKIGVSSKTLSQMDLSELALWTVRPRLMAVPGVANVAIWGQRDRQLQVRVDPDRLAAHGVSLDAVTRAAGEPSSSRPEGSSINPTSVCRSAIWPPWKLRKTWPARWSSSPAASRCAWEMWPRWSKAIRRPSAMRSSTTGRACC